MRFSSGIWDGWVLLSVVTTTNKWLQWRQHKMNHNTKESLPNSYSIRNIKWRKLDDRREMWLVNGLWKNHSNHFHSEISNYWNIMLQRCTLISDWICKMGFPQTRTSPSFYILVGKIWILFSSETQQLVMNSTILRLNVFQKLSNLVDDPFANPVTHVN